MLRHVFLVLDMSRGMEAADLKPSRAAATVALAKEFVREYFDQNPISSLGVIVTRDAVAEKVSEMSGNPRRHTDAIDRACAATSGDMTLQTSLDLAWSTLRLVPRAGTREVILIHGALSTCDPGNIEDTIKKLCELDVRVSVISLPGEVYIAARIAKATGGVYAVPETADALRAALFAQCTPPPRVAGQPAAPWMLIGFPTLVSDAPGLCACHAQLKPRGYVCPRCGGRSCELPTVCPVCRLRLNAAPELARSYHHLFPVRDFVEVPDAGRPGVLVHTHPPPLLPPAAPGNDDVDAAVTGDSDDAVAASKRAAAAEVHEEHVHDDSGVCGGCASRLHADEPRYVCPECRHAFCVSCDAVIHETLHNCPGCVSGLTKA